MLTGVTALVLKSQKSNFAGSLPSFCDMLRYKPGLVHAADHFPGGKKTRDTHNLTHFLCLANGKKLILRAYFNT